MSDTAVRQILRFLPYFSDPGNTFYEVNPSCSGFDPYQYAAEVDQFVKELYDLGFVQSFDWSGWTDDARAYMDDPHRIAVADLITLQKLLTTHVRADRFNGGHLASVIGSGHVAAILTRLATLAETTDG